MTVIFMAARNFRVNGISPRSRIPLGRYPITVARKRATPVGDVPNPPAICLRQRAVLPTKLHRLSHRSGPTNNFLST